MSSSVVETSDWSGAGDPILDGGSEGKDDIEERGLLSAGLVSDFVIQ
jgi:hypothetical protein